MTVKAPGVSAFFHRLEDRQPVEEYNFEHFRPKHVVKDGLRTLTKSGIQPGQLAPDFTLPEASGGSVTLSDLHDKPVLLHFGSYT